jgi:ubiquinol-cytochrome c reductase iron-sulfur subunit
VTTTETGPETPTHGVDDGAVSDGHRTPVAMPVARFDDPLLQPSARHPERAERMIAVILLAGVGGMAGFGAAYVLNVASWILAVTLGGGLFALGFGLTAWGKYLMPRGPYVEDRHPLASTTEERQAMAAALTERTGVMVKRRGMLGGLVASGLGIFTVVAAFPLLRSLGPLPGKILDETDWRKGTRLVDINGRPIHRDEMQPGGLLTVYPHGLQATDQGQAVDQTVLIRVQTTDVVTMKGRESWGPAGYVAYSKVCTHLGCPVGLYEQELELLVCPCHQSMFNVRNGAVPQFGPAPRPLPQLPLYIDTAGYLRSQAGYDQAVGPGQWARTSTQRQNGTA